jgi:hypothetical protein
MSIFRRIKISLPKLIGFINWLLPLYLTAVIFFGDRARDIQETLTSAKTNLFECLISIEASAESRYLKGKKIDSGCYTNFEFEFFAIKNAFFLLGEVIVDKDQSNDEIEMCIQSDSLAECGKKSRNAMFQCQAYFEAKSLNDELYSISLAAGLNRQQNDLGLFFNRIRKQRDDCVNVIQSIERRVLASKWSSLL